jgi:RNA polymerase sigma-70 factor (ECF subfamily)
VKTAGLTSSHRGARWTPGRLGRGLPAGDTDERLVEQALAGQRHAFETLVRRHHRPLVNHLFRQIGEREGALDLAQEVFLKVYLSLSSFDPRYRFTTWLYRIASNCAIDHLRRKQLVTCSLGPEHPDDRRDLSAVVRGDGPGPDEILRLRELEARIDRAVGALPAEFRQLILLRHRLHCRYDEIARITDLPLGTVKNRIFRAREILRQELADLLDREGGP